MKAYSVTDIGQKREINQDYIYCNENSVGALPNLFIVADGMGGHNAGDFASRFCVEQLEKAVRESTERTIIGILDNSIQKTNTLLINKAKDKSDLEGMGTTLVLATIAEHTLYVANVGDSRLYLVNDGIKQITQDHSLVEEMVKTGEIKREEARFHPKKNIITRAIGANATVIPDFFELSISQGDIILLCSDGLSNMVDDQGILKIIHEHKDNLELCGQKLLNCANESGGKDNIAIVLVKNE